jgi:hypothetical protein
MPTATYAGFAIEANGIKAGAANPEYMSGGWDDNLIIVRNCIAAFGEGAGFYDLDYADYKTTHALYYNNTAWKMGSGFYSNGVTDSVETTTYRNNISYASVDRTGGGAVYSVILNCEAGLYPESHNTWDASISGYPWFVETNTVTVTDADFLVTDSATIATQIKSARNANGTLPTITAFHLAPTSDLINAGVNVGLPYFGIPQMGAFEWYGTLKKAAVVNGKFAKSIRGNLLIFNQ